MFLLKLMLLITALIPAEGMWECWKLPCVKRGSSAFLGKPALSLWDKQPLGSLCVSRNVAVTSA